MVMTTAFPQRKLPRVVRLDNSDAEVFETAATPGEWAVPGGFEFLFLDPAALTGKLLQAFRSGFLGIDSLGRSTLVAVSAASENDYQSAIETLARHLCSEFGAPDQEAAMRAAEEEMHYAESLCDQAVDTLLAVERELTEDGIAERFKNFVPSGANWENAKPLVYSEDP